MATRPGSEAPRHPCTLQPPAGFAGARPVRAAGPRLRVKISPRRPASSRTRARRSASSGSPIRTTAPERNLDTRCEFSAAIWRGCSSEARTTRAPPAAIASSVCSNSVWVDSLPPRKCTSSRHSRSSRRRLRRRVSVALERMAWMYSLVKVSAVTYRARAVGRRSRNRPATPCRRWVFPTPDGPCRHSGLNAASSRPSAMRVAAECASRLLAHQKRLEREPVPEHRRPTRARAIVRSVGPRRCRHRNGSASRPGGWASPACDRPGLGPRRASSRPVPSRRSIVPSRRCRRPAIERVGPATRHRPVRDRASLTRPGQNRRSPPDRARRGAHRHLRRGRCSRRAHSIVAQVPSGREQHRERAACAARPGVPRSTSCTRTMHSVGRTAPSCPRHADTLDAGAPGPSRRVETNRSVLELPSPFTQSRGTDARRHTTQVEPGHGAPVAIGRSPFLPGRAMASAGSRQRKGIPQRPFSSHAAPCTRSRINGL